MYAILILPVGSNSILVHPKADKQNHVLSMVNLNNQDCVDLYSAIISFIANRYNGSNPELGRICDYIVGNEIGNSYWNSMGDAPMDEYVKEYERWLRLTNALVKQAWSNARVFASFDYNWAEVTSYSQPELLKQLDRLSKAGGDYDWNVAWHAYPANLLDSETTWNAPNCTDNINTSPIVTWKNLQLLPQFLRDNNIAFNGNTRRIILSEQGFHSKDNSTENQKIQAAAFAYAYYKALSLPEIDYFCLRDGVDHSPETESGLQLGIWTMIEGQEYQPDQQKLIYDVVKYIDTVKSLDATRFVFDVIPDSFGTTWEELVGISEDEIRALCTLPVVETGQTGQLISSGESTTLSAGTTDNWLANDSTSDLTVIHDESLDADVLSMNVFGEYCKDFKGATYTPAEPLDLTGKLLFAKVKANAINANQQMEYMIRAYSGNQVIEGSYEGPAGEWKTVAMDVSSFTGKASVDHIKVWARPTGSTIWTDGSLEIASLSTAPADGADMRNVQVTLNTNTVRREGAEVRVTITNNNGKTVSGDVTFQGVNGLEFDKATQAVTLSDGQSVTIPLKVTKFDVEVMKAGQLAVEFYGLRFEFTLTGLRYPDYTMDGDNMIFGDFEGGLPDGWIAAEDVDSAVPVEHGTQYSDFPAQASKGTYLLEILKSGKVASTRSYVEKIFFEPVDLSEYQTVHVDWAGWGGISYGERYGADLILNFVDGTSESVTKYVTATKEWTKLVFDISEFANRGKVESIKIGYFASGTLIASTAWSGYFFIDNIYASPTGGSGASGGSGGAGDIEVPVEVTLTDNESNVSVSGITVRSDTTLEVTEITDEEDYDYQLLRYAIRNLEGVETAKLLKIEVLRDGMPYPLNGEMTISINRPDGFADKTMVIAHIRGDGSVTYIIPEEKDGKLIFKTDSLISSFGVLAADSIWEFDGVQPPKDDNSATGVTMGYLGFLIPVACIATAVVIATSKRRRIKHSR